MQSQDTNTRTPGAVNHPGTAEWMAFLYEELAPQQKRELGAHLAHCAAFAAQVQTWRASMNALGQWTLPVARPATRRRQWLPGLKWAAAAALVLGLGFGLGRQTSSASAELAALKSSVAQLQEIVRNDRNLDPSGSLAAAMSAAHDETLRLLAEYSSVQEEQRAADRRAVSLALDAMDIRLSKVRTELETVAVNTESGFEQTHENLTHLVSLSLPAEQLEPK